MAFDINGREIPNYNAADLLGSTKPGGSKMEEVLAALGVEMKSSAENTGKLSENILESIKSIDKLTKKLNKLEDTLSKADLLRKGGGSFQKELDQLRKNVPGGGRSKANNNTSPTASVTQKIAKEFGHLDEHAKNYVKNLEKSQSVLKDSLYTAIKNQRLRQKEVDSLRRGVDLRSAYSKHEREILKLIERRIVLEKDESKRNDLLKQYVDYIDEANERAGRLLDFSESIQRSFGRWGDSLETVTKEMDKMGELLIGSSLSAKVDIWQAIKAQVQYNKEAKQTAFAQGEFAQQTKDALKSSDAVLETGKNLVDVQKAYVKNLRAGIKDEKLAMRITKDSLRYSSSLLTDSDETAEMFRTWHQELGLNATEMSQFGRELEFAAKMSGVVGDKLMAAVKSTQKLAENMKSVGTLTAEGAGNMARLVADAQKRGVGNQVEHMLDLLTKGASGFYDAMGSGDRTAIMLSRVAAQQGIMGEVTAGTAVNDPEVMKKLYKGLNDDFNNHLGGTLKSFESNFAKELDAAGIKQIDSITDVTQAIKKLDKGSAAYREALRVVQTGDILSRQLNGMGLGDFERVLETVEEQSKGFAERIEELNSKDMSHATKMDKLNLENEKATLMASAAGRLLTDNDFSSESATKTLNAFLSQQGRFGNAANMSESQRKQLAFEAMAAGANKSREAAIAQGASESNLSGRITSSDIAKAMSSEEGRAQFDEVVQASLNKSAMEMKALQDPASSADRHLANIEAILQDYAGGFFTKVATWLMPLVPIAAGAGQLLLVSKGIGGTISNLYGAFNTAFPKLSRSVDTIKDRTVNYVSHALRRGSIYVHDIHTERLLNQISADLAYGGGPGGYGGYGGHGSSKGRKRRGKSKGGRARSRSRGGRTSHAPRSRRRGFGKRRGFGGIGRLAGIADTAMMFGDMSGATNYLPDEALAGLDMLDMGLAAKDTFDIIRGGEVAADVAKATSVAGKAGGAAKGAGLFGKLAVGGKAVSGVGGKILPFLGPALGALTGAMEGESAGTGLLKGKGIGGKLESGILGALTGDASTGSMFSSSLGIEKGSAADEALGVLGAAGTGAATGAAIGSIIPGVGTLIGAGVGGALGTVAELYKIMTKEDSKLRKHFGSLDKILTHIPNPLSGVTGGFMAMKNASELFGVAEDKVTKSMKASAGIAGTITGTFNSLTFGVFEKHLGPKGTWTKSLANFFNNTTTKLADATKKSGEMVVGFAKQVTPKKALQYALPGGSVAAGIDLISYASKGSVSPKSKESPADVKAKEAAKVGAISPITPGAETLSEDNVAQAVRKERAASSTKTISGAQSLGEVESNTAEMLTTLKSIQSNLAQFIAIMQQSPPNSYDPFVDAGNPAANRRPRGSVNYYEWPIGKHTSIPSKGPVLNGQPM